MGKLAVAHQPEFLPYIGFFQRLIKADLYIVLDNIQYERRNFQNRNKIKTVLGEKWITASLKKQPMETNINEICFHEENDWRTEHLHLIRLNYKKAPFFKQIYPLIEEIYNNECKKLIDFNINAINKLCKLLNIEIDTVLSSSLDAHGKKNGLIVDLVVKAGATGYVSGDGAKKYYDPKPFQAAGIDIIWQNFVHPVYPQINGDFLPYMSTIDLLLNCGIEESQKIIRSTLYQG